MGEQYNQYNNYSQNKINYYIREIQQKPTIEYKCLKSMTETQAACLVMYTERTYDANLLVSHHSVL